MNTESKTEVSSKRGIIICSTQSGRVLTPEEHQILIDGPIAAVADLLEESRKRIDSIPAALPNPPEVRR